MTTLTIKARCWYATENEWRTPGAGPDDCADPDHCWSAQAVVLADGLTAEYLVPASE